MFFEHSAPISFFVYLKLFNQGRIRKKAICCRGSKRCLHCKRVGYLFCHCMHVILFHNKGQAAKNKNLCKQFYLVVEKLSP